MSEAGQRIIKGLEDAIVGNFFRVTVGAQTWIRADRRRHAANSGAWALGYHDRNGGFRVRKIVWGRMLARVEKREGENIRRATILIETPR